MSTDHTLNSWLQGLIPSPCLSNRPRLVVVTGKGGVGKTTLALALTKKWRDEGREAYYLPFQQDLRLLLPNQEKYSLKLETLDSLEAFIAHKLGSQLIAKAAIKAPFLNALFDIIPSLGMIATLGHIVHLLKKNPQHHYILDCPSTGHARMIFNGPSHFEKIFGFGPMRDDLVATQQWLQDEKNCHIIIAAILQEMPLEEMLELKDFFIKTAKKNPLAIINMVIPSRIYHGNAPLSLQRKKRQEEALLKQYNTLELPYIPYIPLDQEGVLIAQLAQTDIFYEYQH